jgi:predicted enzyme related to lactoylglutathione lyase
MAGGPSAPGFFGPILLARDFEATVRFYRSVLGLPLQGASPYAKCVSTPSTFSVVDGKWWAQVNGSENPVQGESSVSDAVLMIQVPDVEKRFRELLAGGADLLSSPTEAPAIGVRTLFLRDPDGRSVVLTSPLD